jgi:predicted nucleic acid-binding protein
VDRVFLDANVLFSASYREQNGLLRLWQLTDVELLTSLYALDEAQRNVLNDAQSERLNRLNVTIVMPIWVHDSLPPGIIIDDKDLPIVLDAVNSQATHLLTGDKRHFGALYGRRVGGVLVVPPSEYLASRLTGP